VEARKADTATAARMRCAVMAMPIRRLSITEGGAALMGKHLPALDHGFPTMVSSINDVLAIQRATAVAAGLPVAGAAAVASFTSRRGHHGQANAE